jgi:ketosteroid isomerase-like protein
MTDNVTTVRGMYEAFGRGDVAAVLAALDDAIEWHEAEGNPLWPGGPFTGPQAVVEGVFAPLAADLDGFTIDVRRMVGCGDTVLVEARYHGTHRATGRALDAQAAHVWDLRDGKAVRFQQYVNTKHLVEVGEPAAVST